jgi:hypothetical protein
MVTGSGGADSGGGTAWGHDGEHHGAAHTTLANLGDRLIQYDPDLSGTNCAVISTVAGDFEGVSGKPLNVENLGSIPEIDIKVLTDSRDRSPLRR